MTRLPRRVVSPLIATILLATLAIPAAIAVAQGTSGALPGPINSRQLSQYAERLGLSASQRLAVNAAHDEYRREFRLLRDGEIATFLREQQAVQGGIPQRQVVEDLLDKVDRLNTKIALLDNRLFDQFLPVLTEQQQVAVPRLRLERERERYANQLMAASYGRRVVDLSRPVLELELTHGQNAAADAILVPYERKLTKTMRQQHEAVTRMTLDMMDILAERGFSEVSQEELLANPKMLEEVLGHIRDAFTGLRAGIAELSDDLRTLNDRTYRQVAAVLPPPEARTLRNAYYRGMHPQLGSLIALSESDWMTKALALPDLAPEQRDMLEMLSGEYQKTLDRLLSKGIERLDAFWADFSPFEVNQERGEQLGRDLAELQKEAGGAKTTMQATARTQLGDAIVDDLTKAIAKLEAAPAASATVDATNTSGSADPDPALDFAFSGDRFLPERISRADIGRYRRQLQLDRDMGAVLDTLHRDYLERLSTMPEFDRLREARSAVDADEGAEAETPVRERIDRVYALRRQAVTAMTAADAGFFDDLAALVGENKQPLLDLVRRSRLRVAYTGSASARLALGRDSSHEAGVDLVSIVLEEQPTERELAAVADVLAAYEGDALQAFQARLEAQLDLQKRADEWTREIREAGREDLAAVIALQQRYREEMKEPTRRVARTDEAIVRLNESTLEAVVAALSSDRGAAIRNAYEHAAFPSIFEDPAAVERHVVAALELEDLTAAQHEKLIDLGATYRTEYTRLTHDMIGHLGTSSVSVVGLDPDGFRAWQQSQQALARIRFDRNELNGRAISELRSLLTPEQIVRIGGLPEPLGEDDFYFYR